jgi:hypothetical protein
VSPPAREEILRPRRPFDASGYPLNFNVRTRVAALLPLVLPFVGFLVGSLVMTQVSRWGALLWVTMTTHGGDFLGAPKRRLLWIFPFALLLHPAPYLAAFVVALTVVTLRGDAAASWLWLWIGVYAYIAFCGLMLLRFHRGQRRIRADAGPNNRGSGRET